MMQNIKFSVLLPVFNSERHLDSCLKSIFQQEYPADLIECLVVDGGSHDNTLDIARKYNVKIFNNPKRLGEFGMKIAAGQARGDLLVVFAADNALVGNDWFLKIAAIFTAHKEISCVWGRMIAAPTDPAIMHYYELIQSEPLAYFLNQNLLGYLKKGKEEETLGLCYKVFTVAPQRPLCWGANGIVYRRERVKDLFLGEKYIGDNEIFQYMVERGDGVVAYSPDIHIYHHTVDSIWQWVKKWRRNYTEIFLVTRKVRRIDWFYFGHFKRKMLFWMVYSLIPIFSITHSLYRMFRDRDYYWLYHPLMCFLQTCTYLYWTLVLREGRKNLLEHIFADSKKGFRPGQ